MKRSDPEVKKDLANPVTFGAPQVSPGVADPRAQQYAKQFSERHGPPKYTAPVAGGPTPPIPRLDIDPSGSLPMSDQANQQRFQQTGPLPGAGSMFQGTQQPTAPQGQLPGAPTQRVSPAATPPGLLPNDLLPEQARKDPNFREGHGSMYAASQPALAYRYGVIRNKQHIPPQKLGAAAPGGLKAETVEGLRAIAEANKSPDGRTEAARAQAAEEDKRVMNEAAAGPAGAAGRFGNAPMDGPNPDTNPTRTVADAVKNMDDFDLNTLREVMMKDIINNEDQRKLIESRCEKLTIDELITKGFVTQKVPIIPGKFEPTFRSLTGEDDLALKRLIMKESQGLEVSERYLLDKFSLMTLVAGVWEINKNPMPDFHDEEGHFDADKFWEKFKFITRYPFHMLASMGVNYFWFDIRVRKLFVADNLGNG
jgi:hypothetical protein